MEGVHDHADRHEHSHCTATVHNICIHPPNVNEDMLSDGESSDLTMHNTLAGTMYASDIISEINGEDSMHYYTQQRLHWATRTGEAVGADPECMYRLMRTLFCQPDGRRSFGWSGGS